MDQGHMQKYRDRKNEILQQRYARSGDIIVAGSDGFWENLGSDDRGRSRALEEISTEILRELKNGKFATVEVAFWQCGFVQQLGGRLQQRTWKNMDSSSGKKDDLTLVVSRMSRVQPMRGVEVRMEGLVNLDRVKQGHSLFRTTQASSK